MHLEFISPVLARWADRTRTDGASGFRHLCLAGDDASRGTDAAYHVLLLTLLTASPSNFFQDTTL